MAQSTVPDPPRQTLARQLDRLEGILDTMQESWQTAAAAAVQPALEQAVQKALPVLLTPLLNHPQFRSARPTSRATPPATLIGVAVRQACRRLGQASRGVWRPLGTVWVFWLGLLGNNPFLGAAAQRLCRWKRSLLGACGGGLATALVIGWAGPWLGMTTGFLAGFLLTLVVHDWPHLRPALTTWIARR